MTQIEFLRRTQGLSQQGLSVKARIPRGTISMIETRRLAPTTGQLRKLGAALGRQAPFDDLTKEVEL
jgi:transcriptional regulator with XRE-family HTH domain